jgi:hypothetical protein
LDTLGFITLRFAKTGVRTFVALVFVKKFNPYDAVRAGLTALPNAAADAAGGLPISDAGGLDMDAKLANTNEVTAARMAELDAANLPAVADAILLDSDELQTDWADGGRLDLLVDAIKALLDDARGEPGQGAPPVNPDLATKIDYLYKAWRNRNTRTATEGRVYADDGTTLDHKATLSDDGTTFDRTEWISGV